MASGEVTHNLNPMLHKECLSWHLQAHRAMATFLMV